MKNIFFVSGLAFYDILCLISFILNAGLRFWLSPVPFHYTVYYPVTWPIQQIAHTGNTLCTVLLCADRYMEICWQEKAQTWFTKGKTKIYLAFISFFCLLFNVPTFFELIHIYAYTPISGAYLPGRYGKGSSADPYPEELVSGWKTMPTDWMCACGFLCNDNHKSQGQSLDDTIIDIGESLCR